MTTSERPTSDALPRVRIEHDGFEGTILPTPDGRPCVYVTRELKQGVVVQQHGTSVVHVYGTKWLTEEVRAMLASAPASPAIGIRAVTDEMVERAADAIKLHQKVPTQDAMGERYFSGFARYILEAALHPAPEAAACAVEPSSYHPIPINPKQPQETSVPKLTSKIAIELVTRIEALEEQISAVYREASEYDGLNNINVIRDIVKAREEAEDSKLTAEGMLAALDLEDEE